MSQPPWIPPAGGGGNEDDASYRGAHSSSDEATTPAADDLWGGPGTPGPWSGGADQPWASSSSTDPWAGAKSAWTADPSDDSGPAFPVPGATPASAPDQPPTGAPAGPPAGRPADAAPTGAPQPWNGEPVPQVAGTPGYGPPSYGDPAGPSAGPAVGEPAFAAPPVQPNPVQAPGQAPFVPPVAPQQQFPPQQSASGPGGEPFRSVRSDAVPPAAGQPPAGQPPAGQPGAGHPHGQPGGPDQPTASPPQQFAPHQQAPQHPPTSAEVYTPAEAPPTPRPPQPELPESMSGLPQYADRLAPAPLPDASAPPAGGAEQGPPPGWGAPLEGAPPMGQQFPPQGQAGAPTGWPNPGQGPVHAAGGTPPPPVMPRPEDLLVNSRPRTLEKPATWGWRGRFSRMTGGMYKPKPSPAELADRQAKLNAQRGFSRPMTVVVIQPKGGAGKTPTTICVSSALGVRRGGYIVGWDNNETRGTLAVRTTNDDNQRTTAWDLLGRLDEFERSEARVGDLGYYMRAQGDAQFDALVSDDNPGNMAQIGEVEFKRIHGVLQRFYRMIIIDTGNNVRSTNWQAAVDHADQIVVVSTYQRDVGYSGSWVLDHLAQTGRDELARDAITVLTAAEPTVDDTVKTELVKHFGARTRAVVEVPYDPHIAEGGPIRWDELSEASKRAWTGVAAAITQTLYDRDQRQLTATGRPVG